MKDGQRQEDGKGKERGKEHKSCIEFIHSRRETDPDETRDVRENVTMGGVSTT